MGVHDVETRVGGDEVADEQAVARGGLLVAFAEGVRRRTMRSGVEAPPHRPGPAIPLGLEQRFVFVVLELRHD